ncbi:MAG: sel1 repeat family protein [Kordiimonadaceae bacterium]|nr:sel1 repeat family protein [Kordiimonadaceae bacterium]
MLKNWVILFSVLLRGCATVKQSCGVFERGSMNYRLCRAENGSKIYQFRYAMELYVIGDVDEARKWLIKASKDDVSYNKQDIDPNGLMSGKNISVTSSKTLEKGDEAAAYMLAKFYFEGLGVKADKKSAEYYRTSARNTVVEIEELSDRFRIHIKTKMAILRNGADENELYELYSFRISK